jgi:hypothetical protein
MIIVKTKNGDRFINEAETLQVSHIKDKETVEVWPSRWGNQQIQPQCFEIRNVEQVIYTDHPHEVDWVDNGSELEKLKAQYDEHLECGKEIRAKYMDLMNECDEMRERLAKLEPKKDPDRWWPDNVDVAPVNILTCHIEKSRSWSAGYGVRLTKVFEANNIKTIGDLLRIGRRDFRKYRSVGGGAITRIDDALEELYDIKGW